MTNIEYENTPILNPSDSNWCRNLYLMWAGAYGDAKCYVWANSFDDAFEHLVEWLDDEHPGYLTTIDYDEAAKELGLEMSDENMEAIAEQAEQDMSIIAHTQLNNGDAIPSWEWGGDDVTDETLDAVKALCAEHADDK